MMCLRVRHLLSSYVDSELSPDEMMEIRSHVFACEECGMELDRIKQTKTSISSLSPVEPDGDLLKLIACKPWQLEGEPQMASARVGSARGTKRIPWLGSRRIWLVPTFATLLGIAFVGIMSYGASIPPAIDRQANAEQLDDSFAVEHTRFEMTSPFANHASLTFDEAGENIKFAAKQSELESDQPFVQVVAERTVR